MTRKTNTQRISDLENSISDIKTMLSQALGQQPPAAPMAPITVPGTLTADIPAAPTPIPAAAPAPIQQQQQERLGDCACCGQRLRVGTIDLRTGEYIPSGMTTKWLKMQQGIVVQMNGQAYQVNGEWLAEELKKRPTDPITGKRQRAVSAPGFLCGESSSSHATIKLPNPILRRATTSEEQAKYRERVLAEAARLR